MVSKNDIDYEMLERRIDRFIVLSKSDLSMAMVGSLLGCLATSYKIPEKEVWSIFNKRHKKIDHEASEVYFDIEELK